MITTHFKTLEGKIPVLVSAPHVFGHKRPLLNCTYKIGEPWTDTIVKGISDDILTSCIYLSSQCDYDPNFQKVLRNDYKKEVRRIIKEEKIKRFVDVHGLKDTYDYDIGIYYTSRFSNSIAFAKDIAKGVNMGLLRGISIQILRFVDNGQETLGEYVASKLRVPSVQIEVARYIREDETLRNELIKNLEEVLKKYI